MSINLHAGFASSRFSASSGEITRSTMRKPTESERIVRRGLTRPRKLAGKRSRGVRSVVPVDEVSSLGCNQIGVLVVSVTEKPEEPTDVGDRNQLYVNERSSSLRAVDSRKRSG